MTFLQKARSNSPTLFLKDPQQSEYTFKTPKQDRGQIIELTIDLSHPSKSIAENPHGGASDVQFLLSNLSLTPRNLQTPNDQVLSYQVSPQKSLSKPNNRNYKTNTHENPRQMLRTPEAPHPKVFYTEPSHYTYKATSNHHLANPIYSLEKEIIAHTKAFLDQNFSTAFTPNSKQTEEDFESQEICEGTSKKSSKMAFLFDADTPCLMRDLSNNVKYVEGGVGIKKFEDSKEFEEFNDRGSFAGKNIEENPKKNQIRSPFSPVLMVSEGKTNQKKGNAKYWEVFKSLLKKIK